jgi:hypothetical protein
VLRIYSANATLSSTNDLLIIQIFEVFDDCTDIGRYRYSMEVAVLHDLGLLLQEFEVADCLTRKAYNSPTTVCPISVTTPSKPLSKAFHATRNQDASVRTYEDLTIGI